MGDNYSNSPVDNTYAQRLEEEETIARTKKKKNVLRIMMGVFIVVIAMVTIKMVVDHRYEGLVRKNIQDKSELTSRPSNYWQNRAKHIIDKDVKIYNKGKFEYNTIKSEIIYLKRQEVSENLMEYLANKQEYVDKLFQSKECYSKALLAKESGQVLEAVFQFGSVIKEDKLYNNSQKEIKGLHKLYYDSLIDSLRNDLFAEDSNDKLKTDLERAIHYYPNDKEINRLQNCFEECGNPLLALINDQIISNLKVVQKDNNHSKAVCTRIQLLEISESQILLIAYFHEDQARVCQFYYLISPVSFSILDQDDYLALFNEERTVRSMSFRWDETLKNTEKRELIYSNLIKFGIHYKGDKKGVENITIDTEAQMRETEEVEDKDSGINLLAVVFLSMLAVIIPIIMLRSVVVSVFKH